MRLKRSQRYFDYLIERAQNQFPIRSAEGKVKALNYLLPHMDARAQTGLCATNWPVRSHKNSASIPPFCGRNSGMWPPNRSTASLKTSLETQVTDAEKLLIRALTSASEMRTNDERFSARDGAEEEFDPARQAHFVLQNEAVACWVSYGIINRHLAWHYGAKPPMSWNCHWPMPTATFWRQS